MSAPEPGDLVRVDSHDLTGSYPKTFLGLVEEMPCGSPGDLAITFVDCEGTDTIPLWRCKVTPMTAVPISLLSDLAEAYDNDYPNLMAEIVGKILAEVLA